MEDDTDIEEYYDKEGSISQGVGLEDACPHDLNIELVNEREVMNIEEEGKLNISEFDEDGNAIGLHTSLYSFFLGQQEKCSFDDPGYRRESVETKEERLKNKPSEFTKIEWNFLVDHLCDEKFKEKSKKASESRANQKMPHYNGTKSFARLRQEIRQKDEGKCSRVVVLVASRTRKSKKVVNALTLEQNTLVVDVLGKDSHGYLRAYGPCKSITQHFKVKPSRLDLSQELIEVKKESGSKQEKMLKMLE
ncbi:Uracil-DNA glycosylase [Bienertia sinuspersici]